MTMTQPHPRNKPLEVDDPMLLRGQSVEGDPEIMLASLVEEFASMGWDATAIVELFERPFFQATSRLRDLFGPDEIRLRIEDVLKRCGVQRFEESHSAHHRSDCPAKGEACDA